MSRDLRTALAELEDDVRLVRLAPAAEIRGRGRGRLLRRRAAVAGGFAVLLVAAIATAGTLLPGERETLPASPGCAAPVDLTLPDSSAGVAVRVLSGAADASRAEQAIKDIRVRIPDARADTTAREELPSGTVAVIRYGPRAVGEAAFLDAMLLGQAEVIFVPSRADARLDLVVGPAYQQLATPTELNRALVEITPQDLPHEC
ncbi:hypothetical protein AB0F72_06920 [Actinoplanes sp. NPDC023936]|uniref:hypothetical protein n=1 Tax=Actinoplanes sp. NPDC023936 TaxID=3154910 RepID=UPI00340F1CB2